MDEMNYRQAGVDIQAGYETVRRIKSHAQSTFRPEVIMDIGSFGGLFALGDKYDQPVLVAGTDGVGTKLKIAFLMDRHDTIGIDLVAYCVNDIICQGAEPLFFLDYLAMGKVEPAKAEDIVKGISAGCKEAGCALIGGETAEMPGFYQTGEYDMAGFAVGVVEKEKIIDGSSVTQGDVIIGLASTGLQSSGYSLVRKVLLEDAQLSIEKHIPELGRSLGEELLKPTGIYAKTLASINHKYTLKGIANISGGGLPENLPRSIAPNLRAVVKKSSWEVPPIFNLIQEYGRIAPMEMFNTFNMGIAMGIITGASDSQGVLEMLNELGQQAWIIGEIVPGQSGVDLVE